MPKGQVTDEELASGPRGSTDRLNGRDCCDLQVFELKGSSGRTRTYNPPVNRGLPCCCWELRIVADSFVVLHLSILASCTKTRRVRNAIVVCWSSSVLLLPSAVH